MPHRIRNKSLFIALVFNGEVMPIKQCAICGDDFNRTANQKTCGRKCSDALRSQRIENLPKVRRKPKYRTCVICGAMFRLLTSGSQITCGNECSRERKRQVSNAREQAEHERPTRKPCVICGELFVVWGTQKTCGKTCSARLGKRATRKRYQRDPEKAKAYRNKWLENPENRERVRESRRRYEIRRLEKMSDDERYRIAELAKSREHNRQRRERRNADSELARLHRKQVAESKARRNKTRQEMTPDELAIARKNDREEMRRYAANPEKRARMNELKRAGVRRRNRENFACTVLNAMKVLTSTLNTEKDNE